MKIVVDVSNKTNTTKFNPGDVLLYNGAEWYVTTREDLLQEAYNVMKNTVHTTEVNLQKNAQKDLELRQEFDAFKKYVNEQLKIMSEILKTQIISKHEGVE